MGYSAEVVRRARARLAQEKEDRASRERQHLAEAYEKVPRIREIDLELRMTMAQAAMAAFQAGTDGKKELEAGRFSEKVLKYLWDDAFKMDKTAIFNENCKSLEDVVITYETATSDKLAAVLRMSVYEKMLSKMQQKNTDNNEN